MFQSLRIKLLLVYYATFAAILTLLGLTVYLGISRLLDRQLNHQLETLANQILDDHQYIEGNESFSPDISRLSSMDVTTEWLDEKGNLIAIEGSHQSLEPISLGIGVIKGKNNLKTELNHPLKTYTLKISIDRSALGKPPLGRYLRLSASTQEMREIKQEVGYILLIMVSFSLGVAGVVGLWLTDQAVKPVEDNVERLKQFTTDASHELRTPLTSIKNCIEVIINHPERIHPKDAQKLGVIANATETMTHLIEDLLFLARNDLNTSLDHKFLDIIELSPLIKELIELLDPLAQEKDIHLRSRLEAEGQIKGDRQQISRLFTNLIENGIKYTPSGGSVFVSLQQSYNQLFIFVEDTGIGIESDQLSKIFDRFWRTDKARQETGSGLGLSIAQAIAKRHGGNIVVTSQVGRGTCFKVSLPLFNGKIG